MTSDVKQGVSAQTLVSVVELGLACCGVEAGAIDLVKKSTDGTEFRVANGLEKDSHILVIAGTVTHPLVPAIQHAYASLAEPKVVVAFGACAITGGPYWDSYSVLPGADRIVKVDIHVPGCPPSPTDLARALQQAQQLLSELLRAR